MKKLYIFLLIVICLAAFMVRYPYTFSMSFNDDESLYMWYAKQLSIDYRYLFSEQILEFHPPLFPVILSLFDIHHRRISSYRMTTLFLSIFGIIFIYFIGLKIRGWFVGLLSSIFLAFNYLYTAESTLVMIDLALSISIMFLFLCILYVSDQDKVLFHILVGIAGGIAILLKYSGIVVLPLIFACYMSIYNLSLSDKIKKFFIPFIIILVIVCLIHIYNFVVVGTPFPYYMPSRFVDYSHLNTTLLFYFKNQHQILMYIPLIIFFYYGLITLIVYKKDRYRWFLLSYVGVLFIIMSFFYIKAYRFSLMFLPSMIIISVIGIDNMLTQFVRWVKRKRYIRVRKTTIELLVILLSVILVGIYQKRVFSLLDGNSTVCVGYLEAARYIKDRCGTDTVIISEMPRVLRYFSDIDFVKFGGKIISLPRKKKQFATLVRQIKGDILLEVSVWDEMQPSELPSFFDYNAEKQYFSTWGFNLVKTIKKNIHINTYEKRLTPVIRIYWRKALNES